MSWKFTYTQVQRSKKPYDCDSCGEVIPAGSSYRWRQGLVNGNTHEAFIRRWHDGCAVPAPFGDWVQHQKDMAAYQAKREQDERLEQEAWEARLVPLLARLESLGVVVRQYPPRGFYITLEGLETLMATIDVLEDRPTETELSQWT